ncbi:Sugar phosphate isomerase/epimerase [Amphibacillus marinus]|uniref:Sugar phosphate isomerase/epimerase n=1 Tax=Amphibacillus marinus TaxID=872970 RepID=A0A1H8PRU0_9BACI|nr:sugar phosphate isomerase/epimerase [Amphibacillus marinus]SEO44732.1 Sugar phosphate isomerase/epimerase [Amphibacillus marinus]
MKFAFSSPTKTDEEQENLFQQFRSIGYEGLQLKPAQYAAYVNDPNAFLRKWGYLDGIASALIAAGRLDEQNQAALRSLFTFAQQVGVERIVFCHGVSRKGVTNEEIASYARILSVLGTEAREQFGIQLSLHHHYDQPVMHREDFDVFFDEVKADSVKLTVDTAHLYKSEVKDIAEVITSFKEVIDNFHLKDFGDGDWKVLGEGEIDFKPVFQAIKQIDYQGWVSADEESGGDLTKGMKDCFTYMNNRLV